MFLAACAYIGAAVSAYRPGAFPQEKGASSDSTRLDGIAVRTEQLVCSVSDYEDGRRIPAGSRLSKPDGEEFFIGESAVYFAEADGYEHISPAELWPFVSKKVEELLQSEARDCRGLSRAVTDHVWYFAALSERELSEGRCRIRFDGGEAYEGEIIAADENAVLIKLRCGGSCLRLRRCTAEIETTK